MKIACVKCKKCGRLGTKNMKWVSVDNGTEEVLLCDCGGKEWEFIAKNADSIGPEVLVIKNSVTIQQDVEVKT